MKQSSKTTEVKLTPENLILATSNWDEFFGKVSEIEKKKAKGDVFERFTKLYLLAAPKYRMLLKNVWLREEIPLDIRKRVELPFDDFGIDGLAETHEGNFWSIQSKFRSDTDSAITYKELSTFKSLSDNSMNIDFCLVVHTSTKPIKNLHLFGENISTLGINEFECIDQELWASIQSATKGEQKELQPLTP